MKFRLKSRSDVAVNPPSHLVLGWIRASDHTARKVAAVIKKPLREALVPLFGPECFDLGVVDADMDTLSYLVVCGTGEDEQAGEYHGSVLATRHVFTTHQEATTYAATIAEARHPLVVEGRFHQLQFDEAWWK